MERKLLRCGGKKDDIATSNFPGVIAPESLKFVSRKVTILKCFILGTK